MPDETMPESERRRPLTVEEREKHQVEEAVEIAQEERIRRLVKEKPIGGGQEDEAPILPVPGAERYPFFARGYGMRQIERIEKAGTAEEMRFAFRRLLGGLEGLYGPYSYIISDQMRGLLDEKRWELIDKPQRGDGETKMLLEVERLRGEFDARADLNSALLIYEQSADDLGTLAGLFLKSKEYTLLGSKDVWETIFTAPFSKEGEKSFGDKIDEGMRWLTLIGISSGPKKLAEEISSKPWLSEMVSQEDQDWLAEIGNISAKEPSADRIEEIREFVLKKLGNDEAIERLAWRLFRMWGISNTFAKDKEIKEGKEKEILGGFPTADDLIKIFHPRLRRELQERAGHVHGPDETVKETPEVFLVDFLRFVRAPWEPKDETSCQEIRSFWELWWNEGKKLGELPWGELPMYAWYQYWLRVFFAGRSSTEGHAGLFEAVTKEGWEFRMMATPVSFRVMDKALNVVVGPWMITGGEYAQFANRTWGELNEMADAEKRRILDMIIRGAEDASKDPTDPEAKEWKGQETRRIRDAQEISRAPFGKAGKK